MELGHAPTPALFESMTGPSCVLHTTKQLSTCLGGQHAHAAAFAGRAPLASLPTIQATAAPHMIGAAAKRLTPHAVTTTACPIALVVTGMQLAISQPTVTSKVAAAAAHNRRGRCYTSLSPANEE